MAIIKAYDDYAAQHQVLTVADDYDQRQQVSVNTFRQRLGWLVPAVSIVVILLFLVILLFWRLRRVKA